MARKRHSDEDILKLLREIELHLAGGTDVATACRAAGISDATYYIWRKKFGGMGCSQLSELKALEKENQRLKKIVADLELDKLILEAAPFTGKLPKTPPMDGIGGTTDAATHHRAVGLQDRTGAALGNLVRGDQMRHRPPMAETTRNSIPG